MTFFDLNRVKRPEPQDGMIRNNNPLMRGR